MPINEKILIHIVRFVNLRVVDPRGVEPLCDSLMGYTAYPVGPPLVLKYHERNNIAICIGILFRGFSYRMLRQSGVRFVP